MVKYYRILAAALLGVALGSPTQLFSYNESQHTYRPLLSEHKNSWRYLEEIIISTPERAVDTWFGKGGATALASVGTCIAGYYLSQKLFGESTVGKLGSAATGISLGALQHAALRSYLLQREEHKQLTMMMQLWPHVRDRIPPEVWPSLDSLHDTWLNNNESYESCIDATLSHLKSEVYSQFPSRYKKSAESFFTTKNLHVRVTFNAYKFLKRAFRSIKELLD